MLREFAKYAFFGLTRQNPVFERSVLKYVSIKNRILTTSGQKRRVCVNTLDRLTHTAPILSLPFHSPHGSAAKPTRPKGPALACWPFSAGLPEEGIGKSKRRSVSACTPHVFRACPPDLGRASAWRCRVSSGRGKPDRRVRPQTARLQVCAAVLLHCGQWAYREFHRP